MRIIFNLVAFIIRNKYNDELIVAMYRVIHKSLRDFRPLRYSSRDGHAEGEHVNRGRDTPKRLMNNPVYSTRPSGRAV
jgi:hypothetical protein